MSVKAALIGAGEFGRSLLAQSRSIPELTIAAVLDREPERAVSALRNAGFGEAETQRPGRAAPGRVAVLDDPARLAELQIDIVVEATGDPEAGAANALAAIEAGRHVAMVTKETDIVVGPILARLARQAGLSYTLVDGDQPSLLIKLCARLKRLGFTITAAGKATEYDCVAAADLGSAESNGLPLSTPQLAACWQLEAADLPAGLAARAAALEGALRQTAPDLCELGIVANATGLLPDCPGLHAPFLRPLELPEVFRPAEEGGLLRRGGTVDAFVCLRRAEELSFAGGVFAVVACPDPALGRLFAAKGLPVSRDHRQLLVHNPVHLLGAEAPISLLEAMDPRQAASAPAPRVDLCAETRAPLAEGSLLILGERHALPGTAPRLLPAAALGPAAPLPYYLAAGARLRRDLPAGATITLEDVELPGDSALLALRRQQDETFLGGPSPEG